MQLFQVFPISKVQSEVCSNDGFADDFQDLLILIGIHIRKNIMAFQLLKKPTQP